MQFVVVVVKSLPLRNFILFGSGGLQSNEAIAIIFLLWLHNFVRSPVFVSGNKTHGLLTTCNKITKNQFRFECRV